MITLNDFYRIMKIHWGFDKPRYKQGTISTNFYEQLSCAKIPKMQKDTHDNTVLLPFLDLRLNMLVKLTSECDNSTKSLRYFSRKHFDWQIMQPTSSRDKIVHFWRTLITSILKKRIFDFRDLLVFAFVLAFDTPESYNYSFEY